MEVFYRWHPLNGRRVRRQYSERRATGKVVHVEVTPGVVIALAGWMLDAAKCAALTLGPPQASLEALTDSIAYWSHAGSRMFIGDRET